MATSGKQRSDADVRETRRLRNDVGLSVRQTAKVMGVSPTTVQKDCKIDVDKWYSSNRTCE